MAKRELYKKSDWKRFVSDRSTSHLSAETYRHDVRRDFARLVHSPAFRRLQGKTQLFPGHESDFFRNRLTHSLEVAQIAKSIAIRLNSTEKFLKSRQLDLDLVEFAGLAHDLGHPPFGHNGEHALDQLMIEHGGFEGNAQTLRLLARVEKKVTDVFPARSSRPPLAVDPVTRTDLRAGLNLTLRTLASILKYDRVIPSTRSARSDANTEKKAVKGYYGSEAALVAKIKSAVGSRPGAIFKTVECQIMDIADDIAYSTYDLEDSFKADFQSPLMMISMSDDFKRTIAAKVKSNIDEKYGDLAQGQRVFDISDVNTILAEIFSSVFLPSDAMVRRARTGGGIRLDELAFMMSSSAYDTAKELGRNGYIRTAFTSYLVGRFIRDVEFTPDTRYPALSMVRLSLPTFKVVETLKHYTFQLLIESPRLKLAEKRGAEIIKKVFDTLCDDPKLLPEDWRSLFSEFSSAQDQRRTISDYIAGMSDIYCIEFHSRVTGTNPPSLWKPH